MAIESRRIIFLLLALLAVERGARAQQPPPTTQGPPQQPSNGTSSVNQQTPTTASHDDALDNILLEEADEEHITYMDSHITLEYNHDALEGGSSLDQIQVHWLQALGASKRLAAGIEVPFLHLHGANAQPSANGIGDVTLEFRGMLTKGEKFEQAAGLELRLPSASNELLGESQTVFKPEWGFSAQITSRTLLSGEVGYNRGVHSGPPQTEINNIEPELILSQAFAKRFGAFLEWNSYYQFNVSKFVQTLKVGLEVELDRKQKWSIAPYAVFPLNHISREEEFKNSVGFDLIYNF